MREDVRESDERNTIKKLLLLAHEGQTLIGIVVIRFIITIVSGGAGVSFVLRTTHVANLQPNMVMYIVKICILFCYESQGQKTSEHVMRFSMRQAVLHESILSAASKRWRHTESVKRGTKGG